MIPNVRVHLEHAWDRQGWNVYIASDPRPGTVTIWEWDGKDWFGTDHPEGVRLDSAPRLFLPEQLLKALVDEATKKLPADGAMADHLRDAQGVRDRLLAMIEARGLR